MRFTTLRNLMLSMLVLGGAGAVIGAGSGTFAQFNAVTTSTGNTFSSAAITFSNTTAGGTCTSTAGAAATGACTQMATLGSMVPGDSKTMLTTLTNGGNAGVSVGLAVADAASTHDNIVTSGIGAAKNTPPGTYGLGLVIFECRDGSHNDVACSSANVAELYTVYGACGASGSPSANAVVTQAGAFSASRVNTTNLTDNGINVGTGSNGVCYGGNTAAGISSATPSIVAATGAPTAGNTNPLATNKTDNLAIVVYLPYTADNTTQNKTTPNLTFTWPATQRAGASS